MSLGPTWSSRSRRAGVRAFVAWLCAALILGPFLAVGSAQEGEQVGPVFQLPPRRPCAIQGQVQYMGMWSKARAPHFTGGSQVMTDFTVFPYDPDLIYATNGTVVMRTTDGGCHWSEVYELPTAPTLEQTLSSSESRIEDLVAQVVEGTPGIYLALSQLRPVARPRILVSSNAGKSWRSADSGLEAALGTPIELGTAGGFLYLLSGGDPEAPLPAGVGEIQSLYASPLGGAWELRHAWTTQALPGGLDGAPQVTNAGFPASGVEIDNGNPNDVWLYGDRGAAHSTDGGATFRFRDQLTDVPVSALDITTLGAGQRVAAGRKDRATVEYSLIGRPFQPIRVDGVVNSIASPPGFADMFAASHSQGVTLVIPECKLRFDLTPKDGAIPRSLHQTSSLGSAIVGRTDDFIYSRQFSPEEMERWRLRCFDDEIANIPVDLPELIPIEEQPGSLEPKYAKVVLEKGETKTIDYTFVLPPAPNPLDVHFLIDVSDSMSEEINGIRAAMADIVTELNNEGIDVWFGVGQYRSYEDDPAYDRVRDINLPDGGLVSALNELQALGGGEETQLAALVQVATGQGQNGPGLARITPGLDSHWRDGSLRVIIHATDEVFSTGGAHPSYEEVAGALRLDEILQAGIAIQDTATSLQDPLVETPRDGLVRVARDSNALAQGDGLDCDGDGDAEVPPGEELVCTVDPSESSQASVMGPAIVNVLRSLVDVGSVIITPRVSGSIERGEQVVAQISPNFVSDLNFKTSNTFDFSVTYKCPALKEPDKFPVDIVVSREAGTLASTHTDVICEVPSKPPLPPKPVMLLPALLPPLAPLPPVAPQPPEIAPNPRPNPQPQGQPQAQAQGAMATQEQKEPQLAIAVASHKEIETAMAAERGTEEYAMSHQRNPNSGPDPQFLMMLGAASLTFMFGYSSLARQRVQTEQVKR